MIKLMTIILFISTLAIIIGLIKPTWVIFWKNKALRNRKTVISNYGISLVLSFFILIGLLVNLKFTILLSSLSFSVISLIVLLIGVVVPTKVFLFGIKTRKRVLLQYGILFILMFSLLVFVSLQIPSKEVDERIFGATYEGEYKEGKKNGNGKVYNASTYYDGEWKNNARNGYGVEYTNFGFLTMKYEGQWRDDQENGQGKMTVNLLWMKTVYKGEFLNGNREGIGKNTDRAGNIYEGEWKNDAPNGHGKITTSNGETYEGEVINWKRHGKGRAVSKDGEVLEGTWAEDKLVEE